METKGLCGTCGTEAQLEYENRIVNLEGAGVLRLVGVPRYFCPRCASRFYDDLIEKIIEETTVDNQAHVGEKFLLWSGNKFVDVDPKRFQLPDYPDRYVQRPKRKVEC